ncbi:MULTISPECIES: protein-arginine deiminase family protein [unclassified Streptomyces]|nr:MULTISPECIES: protein-arginine deiminase family protein [unclassified Streptomyces]MDF3144406.1 protein-arginine deiminase family protein [Streptomyces sp. T21Q-yed]WDF35820.1 protein-arginine deiminase family protein [Streptomyces sp. T12]
MRTDRDLAVGLDDWRTHHVFGGEVHCGTHTIRAAGTPWWNSPK